MEYYCTEWHNGSIHPKLHMLEDHATDFVEKWKTGFGIMVSRVENQFTTTYSRMQPASKRLESMLQEHYSRIHPESKAIKLKSKFCRKRKTTL